MKLKDFLGQKSEELWEGFVKELDKVLNLNSCSSTPYYIVYNLRSDPLDKSLMREVFAISLIKPPYDSSVLVFLVDPSMGLFRLEKEYVNPDVSNVKSIITAQDIVYVDRAMKKEFKKEVKR